VNPDEFPRVALPGVDRADVAALDEAVSIETQFRFAALRALLGKPRKGPLYRGTVPTAVKAKRREVGRRQRAARKLHR
jgi:hypothetical protein